MRESADEPKMQDERARTHLDDLEEVGLAARLAVDAAQHALEVGQLLAHDVERRRERSVGEEVLDGVEAASMGEGGRQLAGGEREQRRESERTGR